ncbi:unnamed protein product [Mytilus coruscus]|uniref:HTH CENPB-type domain-containing protein n=1 Tax=Mytilus coruscus TaxID=42192 RepID=A0A6J8DTH6_MYTCO|nr:unnamed protein product [Mytilus coruscus]
MGKRNKYRNYALEDIKKAVQMVENKSMSIRSASRQYNVPKTTIIDKLNWRSNLQSRSGPNPVLYDSEEEMLVHWVIDMAKIGYGQTKQQLLYMVKTILDHDGRKTPFKDNLLGKDWLYAFMKRHPEISTRTPQKLADKSQITVLACMSATAHYLPPMLVFPGERFRYNPLEGFTEAVLGRTKTGWMDSELFYTWVRDHFITAIKDRKVKRPVILLVDGHTSHISLETAQLFEPSAVFARAKSDQDLGNDDDMNCKDAQVDSRPVTNSSGTYILDPEPVQIADEAETEIALMPSEICDSVSCETSHTIVEELHDQPSCLYPETIIQVNPCNVNVTPHTETNKHSREKAPSSSFELLFVTPNEQKTLKKRKTRTVLPKAVSGSEMIKILENRKQQKEDEQEMKENRKIDRELKRKLKEEEMLKGRRRKTRKRKERKKIRNVNYQKICSKCLFETDDVYICCEICSSFYHAKCSGVDLSCVHIDDIVSFPYECDDCL